LAGETGDSADKQDAIVLLGLERYDRAPSSPWQVAWFGTGSVHLSVFPFTPIEVWTMNTPVRPFEIQESDERIIGAYITYNAKYKC
jgi:hypothetical protein